MKKQVAERALLRRINRKLAHENQVVQVAREDNRWINDTGRYYIVDTNFNRIEAPHQDLENLGRELGVLKEWESVEGAK